MTTCMHACVCARVLSCVCMCNTCSKRIFCLVFQLYYLKTLSHTQREKERH